MEQPTVRVVYGLTLETGKRLRAEMEQAAREAGIEITPICRYRKEGVYQYMTEQQDSILILEERLQASSPYVDEDIIKMTEAGKTKIIFLLDQRHFGSDYIRTLYLCGILNAVFIQEATGAELVRLLITGRTNEEARKYYGIRLHRDIQKELAEINSEYLGICLEYIEDSTIQSEMDSRYRFAASRLSGEENKVLIDSLSPEILRFLEGNEIYRQYRGGRERKGFLSRLTAGGKKKPEPDMRMERAVLENELPMGMEPEIHLEPSGHLLETEGEEDMLAVLDRFRNFRDNSSTEENQPVRRDTLIDFGHYLQTLDA